VFVLVFGAIAYLLLAGIVLGVRRLEVVGEHWVFAIFTVTLLKGASHSPAWLPALAVALAIYGLRLAAWNRARRSRPAT
jgi:hypothetical protein